MTTDSKVWLGADPGGAGCFGVAILGPQGSTKTWCVDCADHAVEVLLDHLSLAPGGVGVDAPLWWSSGRSSDRCADQRLRKMYRLKSGNVQTANSLKGAALVQGAMFVHRLRQHFPGLPVTESHPKALLKAINASDWSVVAQRFQIDPLPPSCQEHERDAILGALAAREGFEGRWTLDLSTERLPSEQDPSSYWLAPVNYFWPAK